MPNGEIVEAVGASLGSGWIAVVVVVVFIVWAVAGSSVAILWQMMTMMRGKRRQK